MNHYHTFLFLLITSICTISCKWETRVVNDPMARWAQQTGAHYIGHEGYKVDQTHSDKRNTPKNEHLGYAVQVKIYEGKNHQQDAASDFDSLSRVYNISQLWIKKLSQKTIIFRGQYPTKDSFQGIKSLSQIINIKINDKPIFKNAKLVSLGGNTAINHKLSKYDLRNVEGKFSFQVGVYTDKYKNHKQSAEQRVSDLREQGHEAYFYHTRYLSSVTIGVFTEDQAYADAFSTSQNNETFSQRVLDLKKKFPLNLIDGRKAHTTDDKKTPLKSFLVEIPTF